MNIKKISSLCGVLFLFAGLLAFPAEAAVVDVDIVSFSFDPTPVFITVGDTVRWTNLDGPTHTSTSTQALWDSGNLTTGQDFQFTFNQAGTYPYFCSIHPSMTAEVIVKDVSLKADTGSIQASTGGAINFSIAAGAGNAGRVYVLFGTTSGTSPGTPLPGGITTLPINRDNITAILINNINMPLAQNFMKPLNVSGQGAAKLDTFGPIPAGLAGRTLHFAFALTGPFDFASNAVAVAIVP